MFVCGANKYWLILIEQRHVTSVVCEWDQRSAEEHADWTSNRMMWPENWTAAERPIMTCVREARWRCEGERGMRAVHSICLPLLLIRCMWHRCRLTYEMHIYLAALAAICSYAISDWARHPAGLLGQSRYHPILAIIAQYPILWYQYRLNTKHYLSHLNFLTTFNAEAGIKWTRIGQWRHLHCQLFVSLYYVQNHSCNSNIIIQLLNPLMDFQKILHSWLRRRPHPTCKCWRQSDQRGRVCACVKLSPSGVYFFTFFKSHAHRYRSARWTDQRR